MKTMLRRDHRYYCGKCNSRLFDGKNPFKNLEFSVNVKIHCPKCGPIKWEDLARRSYAVAAELYINPDWKWYHRIDAESHELTLKGFYGINRSAGVLRCARCGDMPEFHMWWNQQPTTCTCGGTYHFETVQRAPAAPRVAYCATCMRDVSPYIYFGVPAPVVPHGECDIPMQDQWGKTFDLVRAEVWRRALGKSTEVKEDMDDWPLLFAFHCFCAAAYASLNAKSVFEYVSGMIVWFDQFQEQLYAVTSSLTS